MPRRQALSSLPTAMEPPKKMLKPMAVVPTKPRWFVVSTYLKKNIGQNGNLPQVGVKKKMKPPPSESSEFREVASFTNGWRMGVETLKK